MRILKFSYKLYNFILFFKFIEVVNKKFIKYILFSKNPQKRRFFWERLGILSKVLINRGKERWIWIHANSIGEVNASQILIELIKDKYRKTQILLTTTNFSADERASQLKSTDAVLFFPYDMPFIIKKLLRIFKPACIIIVECDIWPNFVKICKDQSIPVLVVSGIYTNNDSRSLGLRHLYNCTFRLSEEVLKNVDYYYMQTEEDAKMLFNMLSEHKNIISTGNLKFSCLDWKLANQKKYYYQEFFNIKGDDPVFVVGNVHIEEIEMVLNAFDIVKEKIPTVLMILAPRFMKDVACIVSILRKKRFNYIKRTCLDEQNRTDASIIVLDTMGELPIIYSLGKAAFVGGSLVYLGDMFGGHNILEPVAVGVPVLFGSYMHNFQRIADLFHRRQAGVKVNDVKELADSVIRFINEPLEADKVISNATDLLEENKNVAAKTLAAIDAKIKQLY